MAMNEQDKIEIDAETTNFAHSIGVTGIGQQIALMRYIDSRYEAGAKAERERIAADLSILMDDSNGLRRIVMVEQFIEKLKRGNG